MSRQDLFKRILAALHASALGDTPWTAASKAIDEFCGTKGNHPVYGEGTAVDGIDIFFAEFCFRGERDEEMERLYFGTYHPMDERLPRIRTLPDSKLVHVQSLFSDAASVAAKEPHHVGVLERDVLAFRAARVQSSLTAAMTMPAAAKTAA